MIPNYFTLVLKAKQDHPDAWTHAHVEGDPRRLEWIKLCAADIYRVDGRIGNNGKRGDPTDLSADALNYLGEGNGHTPGGLACAVIDVIQGAGGPNPQPTWNVFTDPQEASGAWVNPSDHPAPPPPLPPPEVPYPGDGVGWLIGEPLFADYAEAQQQPNAGMGVWFWRCAWDVAAGLPVVEAVGKHRAEWRKALGLT